MAIPSRYTPEIIAENIRDGFWTRTTFYDLVVRNAALYPDQEAVVDGTVRLTWASLEQWVERLALGLLEAGLKKDDMVIVQLPNCVELFALRLACEAAGLLCLPVLRTYRQKELEYILTHTRAPAMVIPRRFRDFDYLEMVNGLRRRAPDLKHVIISGGGAGETLSTADMIQRDIERKYPADYLKTTVCPATEYSLVLLTSGTTGLPKFVENPVCAAMLRDRVIMEIIGCTSKDVIGIFSPAAGGANARGYYGSLIVAARVAMIEHFDAGEALRLIEKEKITVLPLVPAQLIMMLRHSRFNKYDLSSLRLLLLTAAAVPYEIAAECEDKFGCTVVQNYSSIDCSVGCIGSLSDPKKVRLTTVGKPFAGARLKIIDDAGDEVQPGQIGEVTLRGPAAASGYYKDPESTRQAWSKDGWFRMGDLGKLDERGNLMLVGRKKDMIIRGGQNVYPQEIESLLVNHPKIATVAVVGFPDPVMGEKACACVVLRSQEQTLDLGEIVSFLKATGIASFKLPERLQIIHELPLVADQKVDKKALKEYIIRKITLPTLGGTN